METKKQFKPFHETVVAMIKTILGDTIPTDPKTRRALFTLLRLIGETDLPSEEVMDMDTTLDDLAFSIISNLGRNQAWLDDITRAE